MKDKNGRKIECLQIVNVPPPNDSDIYNHEFTGVVDGFSGEYVIVMDGDDNCFNIEPERLEIEEGEVFHKFFVDVPDSDPDADTFVNVTSFKTKEEALKFVQEKYGADENGMISLISQA